MQNLKNNRYVAYLALHVLYVLRISLDIISRIQRFDYAGNKKNILIALTVLYAGFIFYLSSQANLSVPSSVFKIPIMYQLADIFKELGLDIFIDIAAYAYQHMDKVAHMFLYFGLGVLLHLTFRHSDHVLLRKYAAIFAIVLGIIYGITDEFHQSFVPGRSSSIHDLLADGIGVTIAQILFVILILVNIRWKKDKKDRDDQERE
ncbi:VanZ family protein [Methanolobus profundi]|uniref:VanZ like family protein n=1 Tax=Methanolobus profundi TaxID=487685 RepID=A0A1I4RX55_9EURY|nr:VanZ family protein [Methanolobus profundi]SFM56614.1 VanZ like family protein [Methanolobus profundi]